VLKTLNFDEGQAELVGGEIMLFTGKNFMVTRPTRRQQGPQASSSPPGE
jgi:hypothetical protein